MSYPNFPNAARRTRLLQAHELRLQGLTLRQIAARMDCAHSTVAGYLNDFELFRTDLIAELAADRIVSCLIQLAEIDDEHHDRRLAAMRELRLLLAALPVIRRDDSERTSDLVRSGVSVDRYGTRYPRPDRLYPPTPEELALAEQADHTPEPLEPDQLLAYTPEPSRTEPNIPEQEISPNPAHDGRSSQPHRNLAPAEPLDDLIHETLELFPHLKGGSERHILNALEAFTGPGTAPRSLDSAHGTATDQGADPAAEPDLHADARAAAGAADASPVDDRAHLGSRAGGLAAVPG